MIYVTGDTHGSFERFASRNFPDQKMMTRDDLVIVCGDFGGVWSDSPEERHWLDWLNDKPFTTLFVDGNHENFDRLCDGEFEEIDYCGGKAHRIRQNVLHLMRGHVFEFEGKKFFAFGGASSHDIRDGILDPDDFKDKEEFKRQRSRMRRMGLQFRVKGQSWWPQEMPSEEEMQRGIDNLARHDNQVDYVISHCLPQQIAAAFSMGLYESDPLTLYFNKLVFDGLKFERWFCGHYHIDGRVMGKFDVLYEKMVRIL